MPARIADSRRILAISPHLDDAVLSVGGIIARAVGGGAEVVVATVFTADAPHPAISSPIIEELNKHWNLGPSPFAHRRGEDFAAVRALGARVSHGGLPDAIYRTDQERNCLYLTRTDIFSAPSHNDDIAFALDRLFNDWIEDFQPDAVLCPLAVGRHVDHVVTSESFRAIASGRNLKVFLYEDFPYSTGRFPPQFPDSVEAALRRSQWAIAHLERVSVDVSAKIGAILEYASQIKDLFGNAEQLQIAVRHAMSSANSRGGFCETVWATSG